jgi:DNA segregation ATPase FtsK/SpoIIIE, S-DNA-T family
MARAMRGTLGVADPPPQQETHFSAANSPDRIAATAPEKAAASPQQSASPQHSASPPAVAWTERDDPVWIVRPDQRSLLEIRAVGGLGAGRVWPLGMGIHDIGSVPGSTIQISGDGVPERGIQVKVGPSGQAWLLPPSNAAGSFPIRVNMIKPLEGGVRPRREAYEIPWPIGGELVLGDVLLRATSPSVADAAIVKSSGRPGYDYIRVPRTVPPLPGGRFRLPHPPAARRRSRIYAAIIAVAVVVAGTGTALLLGSFNFLVFALIGYVLAGINWIRGRRAARRSFRGDLKAYWEGRAATNAVIRQVIAEEWELRRDTLMDPAHAALTAIGPGRRLWERRRGDADHLVLRVGTLNQPSVIEIEDPSREDARRIFRRNLPDVPLAVDVAARGVLGLVGENAATRAMAAWMVIQAAVLHSPRELQICLLTDGSAQAVWDWVRRLPHAWRGPAVLVGSDPESVDDCVGELVSVIRTRGRGGAGAASSAVFSGPDIIVVLDGARRFRDVDGMARVLAEGPALRVFSICLDEQERFLPRECTGVLWCDPAAVTVSQQDLPDFTGIRPDLVTPAWCDRVASSLTELHDVPVARDAAPARPGTLPG